MKYYKLSRAEILIILGILIAIGTVSYFLYQSLTVSARRTLDESRQIGRVTSVRGDVKILPGESTMWESARTDDFLANLDKLFNGDRAESNVTLINGAHVRLEDNTLVQFFREPDATIGIDISSGRVEIDSEYATSELTLRLSGQEQDYRITHRGKIAVNLSRPAGRGLQSEQCRTYVITFDDDKLSQRTIDCHGNQVVGDTAAFALISPTLDLTAYHSQGAEFRWLAIDEVARYDAIYAAIYRIDGDHAHPFHRQDITRESHYEHPSFPAGAYIWQIETEDHMPLSMPEVFNIRPIIYPKLRAPVADQNVFYYKNVARLSFAWDGGEFPVKFQIAADPNFMRLYYNQVTTSAAAVVGGDAFEQMTRSRKIYWRVIPQIPNLIPEEIPDHRVPHQSFDFTSATPYVTPSHDRIFSRVEHYLEQIDFSWPKAEIPRFELVVTNADTNEVEHRIRTEEGRVEVKRLPPGNYGWRLSAILEDEARTPADDAPRVITLVSRSFMVPAVKGVIPDDVFHAVSQNKQDPLRWDIEVSFTRPAYMFENFEMALVDTADGKRLSPFRVRGAESPTGHLAYTGLEDRDYALTVTPNYADTPVMTYPINLKGRSPIQPPTALVVSQTLTPDGTKRMHLAWNISDLTQSYQIELILDADTPITARTPPLEKILTTDTGASFRMPDAWIGTHIVVQLSAVDLRGRVSFPHEETIRVAEKFTIIHAAAE